MNGIVETPRTATPRSAVISPLQPRHPSPADMARRVRGGEPRATLSGREKLLIATLALVVHGALFHWAANRDTTPAPIEPPQVPEMVIEFAAPPPPPPPPPPEPPPPEPIPEPVVEPPPPVVEELAVKPPPKPKPKPLPKPIPKPVEPPPPVTPPQANAAYLRNPAPEYPSLAQRRNWQGTVLLRVHVLANGRPGDIQVQTSSGRPVLDEAALKAVRKWAFVPAKQGDTPLDGWVSVPIDFKLN